MTNGVAHIYFITQGISFNVPLLFRVQGHLLFSVPSVQGRYNKASTSV